MLSRVSSAELTEWAGYFLLDRHEREAEEAKHEHH